MSPQNPDKLEFSNGLPCKLFFPARFKFQITKIFKIIDFFSPPPTPTRPFTPAVTRGIFKGHHTFTAPLILARAKQEYKAAEKGDPDGVTKTRYNLLRLALFKGLRGETVKHKEILPLIPTTHPKARTILIAQAADQLQDLFGLDLREKYKRKDQGKKRKGKKRRKKSTSQEGEHDEDVQGGGDDEDDDDEDRVDLVGTHDYYVVSTLAPPPEQLRKPTHVAKTSASVKSVAKYQEAGGLTDAHRQETNGAAGDDVHAERGLIMTVLAMISQGEQDEEGRQYLDEKTLLDRVQELFVSNISNGARASSNVHARLGSVKTFITDTMVKRDFLRRGPHPSKKTGENQQVLRVYWIGQRAVHVLGMHSLYEWMTTMVRHPFDATQWTEWAKRDGAANAYC